MNIIFISIDFLHPSSFILQQTDLNAYTRPDNLNSYIYISIMSEIAKKNSLTILVHDELRINKTVSFNIKNYFQIFKVK